MKYNTTEAFAQELDQKDPLKEFRNEFLFPKNQDGEPQLYLCGNSLGLQPQQTANYIQKELQDWANYGVNGHTEAEHAWMPYHEFLSESMAKIVGAKPQEVIVMNTLTVNLHLMMVSFYEPKGKRNKIIIEADAFPSDKYAVESQLKFHNIDPAEGLLLWKPRPGEYTCRTEDLEQLLETHKDEVALVMIGSTNYYTGQAFDLKAITKLGHNHGAKVGFDLAHGAGNIQPDLHNTNADFAVWCTYKYLNSGPGSLGGCFVHERHANSPKLKRFVGWWGHDKSTRFNMRKDFTPIPGAEGWQLSNPPILSMAAIRASLEVFERAGFDNLRQKSKQLTGYLAYLVEQLNNPNIRIITPSHPDERGCQLSFQIKGANKSVFDALSKANVVADWREPDVIRIAPTPLYNSYTDVYTFIQRLKQVLA